MSLARARIICLQGKNIHKIGGQTAAALSKRKITTLNRNYKSSNDINSRTLHVSSVSRANGPTNVLEEEEAVQEDAEDQEAEPASGSSLKESRFSSEVDEEQAFNQNAYMLKGPHVDSFISEQVERLKREDLDFDILAEKLGEALDLMGKNEGVPAIAQGSKKGAVSDAGAKEGEEAAFSELDKAHTALSPAERVVDLLDRLTVASSPLLQRIINATDKDLDQLLAELEVDEMATTLGLPSLPRDLVQSPNTLSLDTLARRSGMSSTRALMRDRRLRRKQRAEEGKAGVAEMLAQVQEEGEWDVDDEFRAQQEVLKLTKAADKARGKGKVGQWSDQQKKEMVELLEAAAAVEEGGDKALAEIEQDEARLAFDMQRVNGLSQYKGDYVSKDKWFTTTPSVGLTQPTTHPRTHSIPVASLHFRSYFPHLVDLQTHFVLHSANFLGIPVSKPAHLPTQRTLITVLRGPFVHKKSQENWERKTHKRAIKVWDCDPALLKGWLAYLERHGVEGVGMRITRWEWVSMDYLEGDLKPGEGQLREKDWADVSPSSSTDKAQTLQSKVGGLPSAANEARAEKVLVQDLAAASKPAPASQVEAA
ncbi:hypothetical protein CPB86DRAFT_760796 [Serendipita vermifera]|nr:hypothetical protein CPB86DRAFT_760796 [Serendipita vermifera]